jgi:quercetin dioxygenase-like cupin family protein
MRASAIVALVGLLAVPASAETQQQLLTQGPTTKMPLPDPGHIPLVFGKDIPWKGGEGSQSATLFGDPTKPGIYGVLIRWMPGHNSTPHSHSTPRYAYVVSGTWWVSSSTHYDPSQMYPVPAGSYVTDVPNTIHWDGARAETGPAILMLVGEGPVKTVRYVPKDPSKAPEGQDFVPPQ